jgi:ATP-dependent exoDNAse (exonuclease V) beta subunit
VSELKRLKAAAGSGKTHALTARFLDLLSGAGGEDGRRACSLAQGGNGADGGDGGYCWPEILAATFTNKAAAEMKERVVSALKRAALDIPDGQRADWPARKAEAMVERILRRYHQLNIRTIDSLLNLLLTVFALDAGLPPDFELTFDEREAFGAALDRIVAACEAGDDRLIAMYDQALAGLLEHERGAGGEPVSGFALTEKLRARLLELAKLLLREEAEPETDPERLAAMLVPSYDAYREAARALIACVEGSGAEPLKYFQEFLGRCLPSELFEGLHCQLTYATKPALADCVKKASRERLSEDHERCYADFKARLEDYRIRHAVLHRAYAMAPSVELARRALKEMTRMERASGRVLALTLPGRVRGLLGGEFGVPDAFCRLGARLHHLLLDEFQDTSREQWAAITPLAEECLAKGGSLFYVGDVKQAIYGWRGGDASLFDEVAGQPGLAEMVERPELGSLERNWRSRERVVDFNNDFFSRLTGGDAAYALADALADEVLPKAPPESRERFARLLRAAYENPAQLLPEGRDRSGGYVRLSLLPGGTAEDVATQALEAAGDLVEEILGRRPASDVCLLVRNNIHAGLLCDELVRRGVPVVTESSLKLKAHPVPRQLAALLAVVDYPADDAAFAEFITGDLFLRAAGLGGAEVLDWMAGRGPGPLHLAFREAFPDAWERVLGPFVSKAGLMTPYDLASDAARLLRATHAHPGCELFLKRFLELVHRAGEAGAATLTDFLDLWNERGDEETVPLPESLDAVRIMTGHKAKGLQFPVVAVPFTYWGRRPGPPPPVLVELDGRCVLTGLAAELGAPHYDAQADRALEEVNLLYVACTRAEEELYVFLPDETPKSGGGAALAALKLLHPLDPAHPEYALGEPERSPRHTPDLPPAHAASEADAEAEQDPGLMAWLPRLRVYRHMEEGAEGTLSATLRGEAAHRAVELLSGRGAPFRPVDLARARALAMSDFPALAALPEEDRARLEADMDAMLAWVADHGELPGLLASGEAELPMIDADGGLRRADFVHLGEGESVVLELKTGARNPDHARQLGEYLDILATARPGRPARGLLVYLDLRETEAVRGTPPEARA